MTDYPRLTEMGVVNPQEIISFTVNSVDYNDFLRIVYDRPKGSFLPVTRSYRFPRVQKALGTAGDATANKAVMESSPMMREALAELQALLSTKEQKQDIAADMLEELRQFEEEFAMHCERMKGLIDKSQSI